MAIQICTLWFCDDCTLWEVNRDDSGASEDWSRDKFLSELTDGLFGVPLHFLSFAVNEHDEHDVDGNPLDENGIIDFDTRTPCDSCGDRLAGRRTRFAAFQPS